MKTCPKVTTEPSSQQKTMEYLEKDNYHAPRYIPASAYYVFQVNVSHEVYSLEVSDEEFFLASISGDNYKSWLEEEDIIDHSKRKPL
ncbi:hypothetical protein KAX06_01480 [candidate division WOR-3 bacterium]|nr:hypothetical protein [candidate division WOR-3 bacterium]